MSPTEEIPDDLIPTTFRIPRGMLDDLKKVAKANKRTVSDEIRMGITHRIEYPTDKREESELKACDFSWERDPDKARLHVDTPLRLDQGTTEEVKRALAKVLNRCEDELRWKYRVRRNFFRMLAADMLWALHDATDGGKK